MNIPSDKVTFKVRCISLKFSGYDPELDDGMEVGDVMTAWDLNGGAVDVLSKTGKESALFSGEWELVTE